MPDFDTMKTNGFKLEQSSKKGGAELAQPVKFRLPEQKLGIKGSLVVALLTVVTFMYDLTTMLFGFYRLNEKRQKILDHHTAIKAELVSCFKDSKTWQSTCWEQQSKQLKELKLNTMSKIFAYAVHKNREKRSLGTRITPKIGSDDVKGKMDEYVWQSYSKVDEISTFFASGLTTLNLKPKDRICIFAETRAEWFIGAMGAFKNSYTIVTLYPRLGEDAIVHGLNETKATVVLTSHDSLPIFKTILSKTTHVRNIIYMEHSKQKTDILSYLSMVTLNAFSDIVERGRERSVELKSPEPDDVALIMYTSGSTGVPKGVLHSHKALVTAVSGIVDGLGTIYPDDIYIAYLPTAHVFEFTAEAAAFLQGIPIGYSSPRTLTNMSSEIKRGCTGDATELKPTIMIAVPLALDNISKLIKEQVGLSRPFSQAIFSFAYDYKLKWYYGGYNTPIVDAIVFKRARLALGGRVRIIFSGGAQLAEETHEFVRNCLCVNLIQGYGLTETCAIATATMPGDMSVGRVGAPLPSCHLRLVNWDEGNYSVHDKPNPRGELVVGGDHVALGYLNMPEATAADFFVDSTTGVRYFRTGDIGEAYPDGCFRIIDRKKDLIKLQNGEYLSMGKVESILKTSPYVDNVCIYGDPTKNVCVALVIPSQKHLLTLAMRFGKQSQTLEENCADFEIESAFLKEVQNFAASSKLHRFEIPVALKLCSELWTTDNNLLTSSFKLKRNHVEEYYQSDIGRMYARCG